MQVPQFFQSKKVVTGFSPFFLGKSSPFFNSTLLFGSDFIGPEWRAGGVGLDSSSDLIF